jgi:hypothetical protein
MFDELLQQNHARVTRRALFGRASGGLGMAALATLMGQNSDNPPIDNVERLREMALPACYQTVSDLWAMRHAAQQHASQHRLADGQDHAGAIDVHRGGESCAWGDVFPDWSAGSRSTKFGSVAFIRLRFGHR